MIKIENVEKCYDGRCVLQGISLTLSKGEFIAIMGRSGSGKSTLLNMIGGMDVPDKGRVVVREQEVSCMADSQLTLYRRKEIGFIFQAFNLLPNITIYENIKIPLLLNKMNGSGEKVRRFIQLVGLEGKENDQPYQLSGGEQQRVAIARAMIHDPSIILADEPTGNLDSKTAASVMKIISDIARQNDKTVLLVTHDASIAGFADRIIKMKDGVLHS
jgi:putative ABC transport system ATP-binding protein